MTNSPEGTEYQLNLNREPYVLVEAAAAFCDSDPAHFAKDAAVSVARIICEQAGGVDALLAEVQAARDQVHRDITGEA